MIHVYHRCNSGHYFRDEHCPLDGWSSAAPVELATAVQRLRRSGSRLSVAELRSDGVTDEVLKRCIVVDFGDSESVFDAVAPEGYIVNGVRIASRDVDSRFM